MEEDGPFDVRLVYLAIHHILKKRGHFLYADPGGGRLPAFGEIFDEAEQMLADELGIDLACNDRDELARLLMNPVMKLTEKQKKVNALLKAGEKDVYKRQVYFFNYPVQWGRLGGRITAGV